MPPQKLIEYIKEVRDHGKTDREIKKDLLDNGWPEEKIDSAFTRLQNRKSQGRKGLFLEKVKSAGILAPLILSFVGMVAALLNFSEDLYIFGSVAAFLFLSASIGWFIGEYSLKISGLIISFSGVLGLISLGVSFSLVNYYVSSFVGRTFFIILISNFILAIVGYIYFKKREVSKKRERLARKALSLLITFLALIGSSLLTFYLVLGESTALSFVGILLFLVVIIGWSIAKNGSRKGWVAIVLSSIVGILALTLYLLNQRLIEPVEVGAIFGAVITFALLLIFNLFAFRRSREFTGCEGLLNAEKAIEIFFCFSAYVISTYCIALLLLVPIYSPLASSLLILATTSISLILWIVVLYLTLSSLENGVYQKKFKMKLVGVIFLVLFGGINLLVQVDSMKLSYFFLPGVGIIYILSSFIVSGEE